MLLAVTGPVVQEVVDVHFELLQLILLHVSNVVLQLLQCGQLHVRHHAPFFVKAPHDAGYQADHKKETKKEKTRDFEGHNKIRHTLSLGQFKRLLDTDSLA